MMPMRPVHPGEIFEDFLEDFELSTANVAQEHAIPQHVLDGLVAGKVSITAELASQLGQALGTSTEFWLNLQPNFDHLSRGGNLLDADK